MKSDQGQKPGRHTGRRAVILYPDTQVVIETWRREYNEERPKKGLGGLTPTAYARQLTATTKTAKVTAGL